MVTRTSVLLVVFICTLYAETVVSTFPQNSEFKKEDGPFIVSDNLIIPEGARLVINHGCILLFKPFTGIIVEGSLEVRGSSAEPVVFTTINNPVYNTETELLPNPFDWNGILIAPLAGMVRLTDFVLEYSVYGIKSQKETLLISHGTFANNGQFHMATRDVIQPVVESVPFNYKLESERGPSTGGAPPRVSWHRPTGIALVVTGAVAAGLAVYGFVRYADLMDRYNGEDDQDEINRLFDRANRMKNVGIAGAVSGAVLLPVGITLIIRTLPEKEKKSVALDTHFEFPYQSCLRK